MPVGRKLMVVASVLAAGVSAALFFRKDASQVPPRQVGLEDSPFERQVERRASAGAGRVKGTLTGARVDREPAWRVPTAAPAAITERTKAPDGPTFAKSLNPVGALLAPIESVPDDDLGELASGADAIDEAEGSTVEHTIVDGDTLAHLAIRYLGTAERYLEIFELNRDILSTPDLLPIGTLIKIPPRSAAPSSNGGSGTRSEGDEIPLPIVPIEPLKSEPAAAAAE